MIPLPHVPEAESLDELVADCVDVRAAVDCVDLRATVDDVAAAPARGPVVTLVIPDHTAALIEGFGPYGS